MSIEAGAVFIALATFSGAVVGALAQFLLRRKDVHRERQNLRLAILHELKAMPELDNDDLQNIGQLESDAFPSSDLFDAVKDDIGLLSSEEVEEIVRTYSGLAVYREVSKMNQSDADLMESTQSLSELGETIEKRRKDAITELEDHLTESSWGIFF